MISNVISYTVAVRLHPVPIYDALLRQDGVPMPEHETHRDLRALTVEQAMRTDLPSARLDERIDDVSRRLEASPYRTLPVVDSSGRLRGIVGRRELANGKPQEVMADVLNREVITVFSDQSLDLALLRLGRHSIRQAPVVTRLGPEHVVGMLSLEDILHRQSHPHQSLTMRRVDWTVHWPTRQLSAGFENTHFGLLGAPMQHCQVEAGLLRHERDVRRRRTVAVCAMRVKALPSRS